MQHNGCLPRQGFRIINASSRSVSSGQAPLQESRQNEWHDIKYQRIMAKAPPCSDNNNNNTIWRGSVLTGEEPPPHFGELKHALLQAGGPTQSQLRQGHHISMEHRLRRKQLNCDSNVSNKTFLKEIEEKRREETFFFLQKKKKNEKH